MTTNMQGNFEAFTTKITKRLPNKITNKREKKTVGKKYIYRVEELVSGHMNLASVIYNDC